MLSVSPTGAAATPHGVDVWGKFPDLAGLVGWRYSVAYTVPSSPDAPDPVSQIIHTIAVYVFDAEGRARDILGTMALRGADIPGIAADLEPLVRQAQG